MSASSIDYAAIREDYDFFLRHSTETAAQIAALRPFFSPPPASMLDFGCGTGSFMASLLQAYPAPALDLALVEPVAQHRAQAERTLKPLAGSVITLDDGPEPENKYELVLANHCIYYVDSLEYTLQSLYSRCRPGGRIILALLDRANLMARLWAEGFAAIGAPFPFHLAEDAEAVLAAAGLPWIRVPVSYRIAFRASDENLDKVLRFLFSARLSGLGGMRGRALFDPYRRGDDVVIETSYPHLIIGKTET